MQCAMPAPGTGICLTQHLSVWLWRCLHAADFTKTQLQEGLVAAGVPDATLEDSTPRIFFEMVDGPELTEEELAALVAVEGEGEVFNTPAPTPATSALAPAPAEEFIDFSDSTTTEEFIDFSLAPTPGPTAPAPAPKAAPKVAPPKAAAAKATTGAVATGAATRPKPDWMQGTAAAGRRRQVLQAAAVADVGADIPTDPSELDAAAIAGTCGVGLYPARIIGFVFDSNSRWVVVCTLHCLALWVCLAGQGDLPACVCLTAVQVCSSQMSILPLHVPAIQVEAEACAQRHVRPAQRCECACLCCCCYCGCWLPPPLLAAAAVICCTACTGRIRHPPVVHCTALVLCLFATHHQSVRCTFLPSHSPTRLPARLPGCPHADKGCPFVCCSRLYRHLLLDPGRLVCSRHPAGLSTAVPLSWLPGPPSRVSVFLQHTLFLHAVRHIPCQRDRLLTLLEKHCSFPHCNTQILSTVRRSSKQVQRFAGATARRRPERGRCQRCLRQWLRSCIRSFLSSDDDKGSDSWQLVLNCSQDLLDGSCAEPRTPLGDEQAPAACCSWKVGGRRPVQLLVALVPTPRSQPLFQHVRSCKQRQPAPSLLFNLPANGLFGQGALRISANRVPARRGQVHASIIIMRLAFATIHSIVPHSASVAPLASLLASRHDARVCEGSGPRPACPAPGIGLPDSGRRTCVR
jgi:hypothetical protein